MPLELCDIQITVLANMMEAREELPRLTRFNALETFAHLNGLDIDKLITELKRLEIIDNDLRSVKD